MSSIMLNYELLNQNKLDLVFLEQKSVNAQVDDIQI